MRHLPVRYKFGHYHIDITLPVVDKPDVKEMTSLLLPLIKALGHARKAFLAPLMRYWVKPCRDDEKHHLNYSASSYLPALGANVFRLHEYIRDSLYPTPRERATSVWSVLTSCWA
jgi:hypothetical protein